MQRASIEFARRDVLQSRAKPEAMPAAPGSPDLVSFPQFEIHQVLWSVQTTDIALRDTH